MKLSALDALLSREISAAAFSASIADELETYRRGLEEPGRSAPVCVIEDQTVAVTHEDTKLLCHLFANGQLGSSELAYIADAMQLAERVEFTDSWVADVVAEFTDPAINGTFTVARALELSGDGA